MRRPEPSDEPLIRPRTLAMLGGAVIALGSFSGVALANYTVAGMTDFYAEVRVEPRRAVESEQWELAQMPPADALLPSGYREDDGAY